jgi:hypothetical protein
MEQVKIPVIVDKNGKKIRQYDILKVFHFWGRKRGHGRQKHYMYKIAYIKQTDIGPQWFFYHNPREFLKNAGKDNLSGGYWAKVIRPELLGLNKAGFDHQFKDIEILDSVLGLEEWCDKQVIK